MNSNNIVWKFPFDVIDIVYISMPSEAKVLHIDVQNDWPTLWALCDPDEGLTVRTFYVRGTGHPMNDASGEHLGTFMMYEDALVFHVFGIR